MSPINPRLTSFFCPSKTTTPTYYQIHLLLRVPFLPKEKNKGQKWETGRVLTFIIRRMVLRTMRIMMKYSNGVETTTLQILYLKLSISFGMYLSKGRAWIAKSMQDF